MSLMQNTGSLSLSQLDHLSVLFDNHAVQRERQRDPLIVFDAAVIVCVEVGQPVCLVEGILLYVQARAVDMRADDVEALLHGRFADYEEHDALVHVGIIQFLPRLERLALFDQCAQILKTVFLGQGDGFLHALALGLALA